MEIASIVCLYKSLGQQWIGFLIGTGVVLPTELENQTMVFGQDLILFKNPCSLSVSMLPPPYRTQSTFEITLLPTGGIKCGIICHTIRPWEVINNFVESHFPVREILQVSKTQWCFILDAEKTVGI